MTGKIPQQNSKIIQKSISKLLCEIMQNPFPFPKWWKPVIFGQNWKFVLQKYGGGADANTQIRTLAEKIETQLAGVPVSKEELEDPQVELLPAVEYEDNGELPEES